MLTVFQTNGNGSEDTQLSYRQQVTRALVQRYIESARREFEETKRKGNRGDHARGCTIIYTYATTRLRRDWSLLLPLRYR